MSFREPSILDSGEAFDIVLSSLARNPERPVNIVLNNIGTVVHFDQALQYNYSGASASQGTLAVMGKSYSPHDSMYDSRAATARETGVKWRNGQC